MRPDLFWRVSKIDVHVDALERIEVSRTSELCSGEAAVLSYEVIDLSVRCDVRHSV